MLLTHSAAPLNNNGFICNMDVTGKLKDISFTLNLYLWVINVSTATNTLSIKGCANIAACAKDSDFSVSIDNTSSYTTNIWKQELINITYKTGTPNTATVKYNNGTVI